MNSIDLMNLNGCVVKNENGTPVARLYEDGDTIVVVREPACTIGTYFYIMYYLMDLGFNVR